MRKATNFPSVFSKYAAPILSAAAAIYLLFAAGDKIIHLERLQTLTDGAGLTALFLLVFCLSLLIPVFTGHVRTLRGLLLCALPVALALFLRVLGLPYISSDYQHFLADWTSFFRARGGFSALGTAVGDYNFPYLYFIAAISYLKIPDLYLIKLFSVLFDVLAAWGGLKLTERLSGNGPGQKLGARPSASISKAPLAAYFLLLLLPTVLLNGACWGQCDSIYTAFAVFSVYCALSDRPLASVALIAAAFAFKLQAIFVMPLFLILLFTRKIKIRHLFLFPVVYLLFCIPALAAGRPFCDIWGIYFNQTNSYNSRLSLNAPSLMALLPQYASVDFWHKAGILAAFVFIVLLFIYFFVKRKALSEHTLFLAALLFSLGIPMLLPHMHERYFFLFEVLTVIYACTTPKRFYLPILVQIASLDGYHAYLAAAYAYPLQWAAILLFISLLILLFDLWKKTRPGQQDFRPEPGGGPKGETA